MKKRTLIILIVVLVISALFVILGAMLKVLYPEQGYPVLMGIGLIGGITSVAFILMGVIRKTLK